MQNTIDKGETEKEDITTIIIIITKTKEKEVGIKKPSKIKVLIK